MNSNIDRQGKKYNIAALVIIFLGLVLLLVFPWLLSQHSWKLDFSETGQIGDTIGGITAPIIGFMSAILIYLSFMIQYRANQMQWQAIRNEQLLSRLPHAMNEIREIIETDKTSDNLTIEDFKNLLISMVLMNFDTNIKLFNTHLVPYRKLIVYLEKTTRLISQIEHSQLSSGLKEDLLLEIVSFDYYLIDIINEIELMVVPAFNDLDNIDDSAHVRNAYIRNTKLLVKKITPYSQTLQRIRKRVL